MALDFAATYKILVLGDSGGNRKDMLVQKIFKFSVT